MITGSLGVGSDPSLSYTVSPTGGVIAFEFTSASDFGTWDFTRYTSVGGVNVSGVTLFSGTSGQSPTQLFIDIGDGSNAPLNPSSLYAYEFTTAAGSVVTPPLSPACSINVYQDSMAQIMFRALQSGINALHIPASFQNTPLVMQAMPLAGAGVPALPMIAFNDTLLQQREIPIGQDVDADADRNAWQVAALALRHFTVFVLAGNVEERDYYRDVVIAIYSAALGPILNKLGNNVTHRFQVSSSQLTGRENDPGFYFSEILLEFTGLYSVGITTSYGLIENFDIQPTESEIDVLVT